VGLFFAALVAPDERGAHDFTGGVEQNRAVHLAGEADTGDFLGANRRFLQGFSYGDAAGAPPIARILLGPARVRRSERLMFFTARCDDGAGNVGQQRACAAGADVNAEEVDVGSPIAEIA
jgi:hypothetical protein